MMPVGAVTYTTPDGVERALRFTLGARKRIAERFQDPNIISILNRFGDGALPEIAYAMMYDAAGDPPRGLDPKELAEALDDAAPLLAAIMAAMSKGSIEKNEVEALLRKKMDEITASQIGAAFGLSPASASDSLPPNSGTAPSGNSTHSSVATAIANGSPTTAAA